MLVRLWSSFCQKNVTFAHRGTVTPRNKEQTDTSSFSTITNSKGSRDKLYVH